MANMISDKCGANVTTRSATSPLLDSGACLEQAQSSAQMHASANVLITA
jgi:hypothetical protein